MLQVLEQKEPTWKHPFPKELYSVERTHAGAVHEGQQPVGRSHVGEVHRELAPMEGVPCWRGEGCEEPYLCLPMPLEGRT